MEFIKSIIYYFAIFYLGSLFYNSIRQVLRNRKGSGAKSEPTEEDFVLVLDSSEWYSKVTVNTKEQTAYFYSSTPDFHSISHSTYQYRFDGLSLEVRLLNDYSNNLGDIHRYVMDGVVLESEIRKRDEGNRLLLIDLEERIQNLRSQLSWTRVQRRDLRYFICAKHPDKFGPLEFRKMVRTDLENLRTSKQILLKKAMDLGLEITELDDGFQILYPEGYPEEKKPAIEQLFSRASLAEIGISMDEIKTFKKIESDILAQLGEKAA